MDSFVTKKKLIELQEELERLKTKGREIVANDLRTAKELGDLSENSEYIEARERQQRVEKKISELEQFVRNAIVISTRKKHDEVEVGSTVVAEREGEKQTFHIVGSNDAKPEEGYVSNESPLGQAFLGHKSGDKVDFKSPRGKTTYKIIEIS